MTAFFLTAATASTNDFLFVRMCRFPIRQVAIATCLHTSMETSSPAVFRDRLFFSTKRKHSPLSKSKERTTGIALLENNESDDGSIVTRNVMDVSFWSHAAIRRDVD